MIKHIWFDFSDTLAKLNTQRHNELKFNSYAQIVKRPLNAQLIQEYGEMLRKYTSNSGVFRALGQPAGYWSEQVNSVDPALLYSLADKNIPKILHKLRAVVPISLFTNIKPEKILLSIGLSTELFDHVIQAGMVKEPKPDLEGFYKIIELTKELPENILYVGDSLGKDIKPAKAVGMQTCLIWDKSPEADYSITKFEELLDIVK
jgi:HAD superfamily hydrolase (TIGR01549 family)